jgi:hypothetical protein
MKDHKSDNMYAHVKKHSMKNQRKAHKRGGKVSQGQEIHDDTPSMVYSGKDSNVVKEAAHKKRGGALKAKHLEAHGDHAKHRLDRPARKHGGKVGSDMSPFSSAHNVKTPAGREVGPGES